MNAWIETLETIEKGSEMAKEPTTQVAFRLPDRLIARLDRHVERMSKEHPGLDFSHADAVRSLLTRALDQIGGIERAHSERELELLPARHHATGPARFELGEPPRSAASAAGSGSMIAGACFDVPRRPTTVPPVAWHHPWLADSHLHSHLRPSARDTLRRLETAIFAC